jgi:hypothetical protein
VALLTALLLLLLGVAAARLQHACSTPLHTTPNPNSTLLLLPPLPQHLQH